ncbi:MAG: N-acetylmuramoyl-L-alanine amidase [Desulfotomaculaceae bacterium]|nr:N-acetylmuramoyl-L-alanine amidase [Desulfotomaculaceae bacterium]
MPYKNRLHFALAFPCILALLFVIFLAYPNISAAGENAVVSVNVANVRSGPGTGNAVTGQVSRGDSLPVLGQADGWYQVNTPNGRTGWIAGWLVAVNTTATPAPTTPGVPSTGEPQSSVQVATVTGSVVNVRSGPGTGNAVTGQVNQGNSLPVLGQADGWYHVNTPNGGTGWIAGWLVSLQSAPPEQPATPTEPVTPGQTVNPVDENPGKVDQDPDSGKASQSGRALSLNVSQSGSKTKTTVLASAPIEYTSFFLSNPDRLVVDLKGITPGDLPSSKVVNSSTVKQIRVGYYQRDPDVTRLVFELLGGAQYEALLSSDRKTLTLQTYIPDLSRAYRGKIIAIDAGHGGSETGAMGKGGTREKEVNLDIAKRVARLLEAKGAKVVMTRSSDSYVGLYERTDKANNANADVFISIHMNANENRSYGGTSTYIYSGYGSARENARIQESSRLAHYVQAELLRSLNLRDAGVREANFAVLRTSDMPAILAEVAFISNAAEEKLMGTDSFRNKAAEAIVRGIGIYFAEKRSA